MNTPTNTPWGAPDIAVQIAPGIISYSCASHGGIWLSPDRNRMVPKQYRDKTFNLLGHRGWYEEDADWTIPAMLYKEEFAAYWKRCGFNVQKYEQDAELIFAHWVLKSDLLQGKAA